MLSQKQIENIIGTSPLIFIGTVKKTGASNLAGLQANDQLSLVEINTVANAPASFQGITGTTVTVKVPDGTTLKAGDARVFYTKGLMYGENLALEATNVDTVDTEHSVIVKGVRDALANIERNEQLSHIDKAELIVEGRVVKMEEAEFNKFFPKNHKAPYWVSVTINVSKVFKGEYKDASAEAYINQGNESNKEALEIEIGQTRVWMLAQEKILKNYKDDSDFYVIEEAGDVLHSYEYVMLTKPNLS